MTISFILLIGLPGSGKTTLGNQISIEKNGKNINTIFIDDISVKCTNAKDYIQNILNNNSSLNCIIISDVFFCNEKTLQQSIEILHQFSHQIEIIYFENNIKNNQKNILNRQKQLEDFRKVDDLLNQLSKIYNPPINSLTTQYF